MWHGNSSASGETKEPRKFGLNHSVERPLLFPLTNSFDELRLLLRCFSLTALLLLLLLLLRLLPLLQL